MYSTLFQLWLFLKHFINKVDEDDDDDDTACKDTS